MFESKWQELKLSIWSSGSTLVQVDLWRKPQRCFGARRVRHVWLPKLLVSNPATRGKQGSFNLEKKNLEIQ